MPLTKEAYKKLNDNTDGVRFIRPFSEYTLKEAFDALNELEELKQRDTPMKVKVNEILTKGAEHKRYTCPSCDYFFGYICTTTTECNVLRDSFCHHCGQRLDWSDDK